MTDTDMEARLAELARLEALKGVRSPSHSQQYFRPAPKTQAQMEAAGAEYERLENLKRPTVLPPKPERNFIEEKRAEMQSEARAERLKKTRFGDVERQ